MSNGRLRPLITGWHRGGLGYTAEVLRAGGIPVSTSLGSDTNPAKLREKLQEEVQVTPYAVPFLDKLPTDVPVIFVSRDPMRIVNSLFFHGTFHGERRNSLADFVYLHFNGFKKKHGGAPINAAVAYVNNWARAAEFKRSTLRYVKVEEGASELFYSITGKRISKFPQISNRVNSSDCPQTLLPKKLPKGRIRDGMMSLLWRMQYHDSHYLPRGGHAHYVNVDWHS